MIRTAVLAIPPRCDSSRENRRPAWLDLGPVTTLIFIGGVRYAASAAEEGRPPRAIALRVVINLSILIQFISIFSKINA